jgi:hypothetical protein
MDKRTANKELVSQSEFGNLTLKELKDKCIKEDLFYGGCFTKADFIRRIDSYKQSQINWDIIARI